MADTSSDLFSRAQNILVGGVDSPVRAFRAVGGTPLVERAKGQPAWPPYTAKSEPPCSSMRNAKSSTIPTPSNASSGTKSTRANQLIDDRAPVLK